MLVSNNVMTDWGAIRETLKLYYADKRDLMTLDHQLKSAIRERGELVEAYYARIQELLTLVSSNITESGQWLGHEAALINLYNQIALDVFIRGLGDPLSMFCKNFKPSNLAEAYSYCVEYTNIHARNSYFKPPMATPVPAPRPFSTVRTGQGGVNHGRNFTPRMPLDMGQNPLRNRSDQTNMFPNGTRTGIRHNFQPPYLTANQNSNRNSNNGHFYQNTNNNFNQSTSNNYRTNTYPVPRLNQPNPYPDSRPFGNNWQSTPLPQPMEVDPSFRARRGPSESMQIQPPAKRVANVIEGATTEEDVRQEAWYLQAAEEAVEDIELQQAEDFHQEEPPTDPPDL